MYSEACVIPLVLQPQLYLPCKSRQQRVMYQLKGSKGAAVFTCITQGLFSCFNVRDQYIDLLIGEIFYLDMKSA